MALTFSFFRLDFRIIVRKLYQFYNESKEKCDRITKND